MKCLLGASNGGLQSRVPCHVHGLKWNRVDDAWLAFPSSEVNQEVLDSNLKNKEKYTTRMTTLAIVLLTIAATVMIEMINPFMFCGV